MYRDGNQDGRCCRNYPFANGAGEGLGWWGGFGLGVLPRRPVFLAIFVFNGDPGAL